MCSVAKAAKAKAGRAGKACVCGKVEGGRQRAGKGVCRLQARAWAGQRVAGQAKAKAGRVWWCVAGKAGGRWCGGHGGKAACEKE